MEPHRIEGRVKIRRAAKTGKWYVYFPLGFGGETHYYPSWRDCVSYLTRLGW